MRGRRRYPRGYIPIYPLNPQSPAQMLAFNLRLIAQGLEKYSPEEVFGEDEMELPDTDNMDGGLDD